MSNKRPSPANFFNEWPYKSARTSSPARYRTLSPARYHPGASRESSPKQNTNKGAGQDGRRTGDSYKPQSQFDSAYSRRERSYPRETRDQPRDRAQTTFSNRCAPNSSSTEPLTGNLRKIAPRTPTTPEVGQSKQVHIAPSPQSVAAGGNECLEELIERLYSEAKKEQLAELWLGVEEKELAQWESQVQEIAQFARDYPAVAEQKSRCRDAVKWQVERRTNEVKRYQEIRRKAGARLASAINAREEPVNNSALGQLQSELMDTRAELRRQNDQINSLSSKIAELDQVPQNHSEDFITKLSETTDTTNKKIDSDIDKLEWRIASIDDKIDAHIGEAKMIQVKHDDILKTHGSDISDITINLHTAKGKPVLTQIGVGTEETIETVTAAMTKLHSRIEDVAERINNLTINSGQATTTALEAKLKKVSTTCNDMVKVVNGTFPKLRGNLEALQAKQAEVEAKHQRENGILASDVAKIEKSLTDLQTVRIGEVAAATKHGVDIENLASEFRQFSSTMNAVRSELQDRLKDQNNDIQELKDKQLRQATKIEDLESSASCATKSLTDLSTAKLNIDALKDDMRKLKESTQVAPQQSYLPSPMNVGASACVSDSSVTLRESVEVNSNAIRSLEDRWNNLTTEPLVNLIAERLHHTTMPQLVERERKMEASLTSLDTRIKALLKDINDLQSLYTGVKKAQVDPTLLKDMQGQLAYRLDGLKQSFENNLQRTQTHDTVLKFYSGSVSKLKTDIGDLKSRADGADEKLKIHATQQVAGDAWRERTATEMKSFRNQTNDRLKKLEDSQFARSFIVSPPADLCSYSDESAGEEIEDFGRRARKPSANQTDAENSDSEDVPLLHCRKREVNTAAESDSTK